MAIADYVLALCEAINASPVISLGTAVRIDTPNSFENDASKIIQSLVTFSPAPEAVPVEVLNELQKIDGLAPLSKLLIWMQIGVSERYAVLSLQFPTPSDQWAGEVIQLLRTNFNRRERARALENVTNLASEYLSHLLIASMSSFHCLDFEPSLIELARNSGGKKTPQMSVNPSPDRNRTLGIQKLLHEANTRRDQGALKELVGYLSLILSNLPQHFYPALQA